MRHSTFAQPLPSDLAPLMAKGYRTSDRPPLAAFETIVAPPGALSATGADMGRFLRALLNGGALDGARILPKARLDEMMAPASATPAGYLGLVFIGTKVAGHDAIGHDGETMTFFSDLKIFPEHGLGIFVSRDGTGDIGGTSAISALPAAIARRLLPRVPEAAVAPAAALPGEAAVAGIYQVSRRAESSLVRLSALVSQTVIKIDHDGKARLFAALFPFGEGVALKPLGRNLYEVPGGARIAYVDAGPESYMAQPAIRLQRVPWALDGRWIAPAFVASTVVALLSLLAWPLGALWRHVRGQRWSRDRHDRGLYLAARLVLLIDAVVIAATATLFALSASDLSILTAALDPLLLALYAFAWLGVVGAIPATWAAARFWRYGVGGRWSRVHHTLLAASCVMIAWFFVTFRIAGTTLTY
jgi:hypothetical protein